MRKIEIKQELIINRKIRKETIETFKENWTPQALQTLQALQTQQVLQTLQALQILQTMIRLLICDKNSKLSKQFKIEILKEMQKLQKNQTFLN